MKKILIWCLVCITFFGIYQYFKKQEEHNLQVIKELTGYNDAYVVWEDSTAEGYSKNFTYWNDSHCVAVIVVRGDDSYYMDGAHCSDTKLVKEGAYD